MGQILSHLGRCYSFFINLVLIFSLQRQLNKELQKVFARHDERMTSEDVSELHSEAKADSADTCHSPAREHIGSMSRSNKLLSHCSGMCADTV